MKRFGYLSLAFALLAAACAESTPEMDGPEPEQTPSTITSVVGQIENQTRASAIFGADDLLQVYWSSSDKVVLTDLTQKSTFTLKSGSGTTKATFTGSLEEGEAPIYAAYPFSAATVANNRLRLTVPTKQTYVSARGIDLKNKILLFATTEDNQTFTFTPAASAIKFDITLPAERVVRTVTMTADQVNIAGMGNVDVETGALTATNSKTLELNYSNPAQNLNATGWATIAPVDFKSASGKVLYDVLTDEGVFTFCYKPEEKFEAGGVYTVHLSVEEFVQVAKKEELKQGEFYCSNGMVVPDPEDPEPEVDPNLNVRCVRATDSTIAIGWTITAANLPYIDQIAPASAADYTTDVTKTYKVAIYRDEACTDLVYAVNNVKNNLVDSGTPPLFNSNLLPPRFIFAGLEAATTYFVKVFNLTDGTSNAKPVQISTCAPAADKNAIVKSNAKAGDMIVFENFAGLVYAGDMTARAAGVSRTDRASLTSFDGVALTGTIEPSTTGYYAVGGGTEIGLFNTLKGLLDEFGVQDWGWIGGKSGANGGSVCARPGYVKIGTTANRSFICTPKLNAIPEGKVATLRVVFNAAPYGSLNESTIYAEEAFMSVKAIKGAVLGSDNGISYSDNNVVSEVTIDLQGSSTSDWKEYSVTLNGVHSGSTIALGGALAATTTNRLLLDDVRVYVDALEEAPAAPVAKGFIKYSDGTPAAGVSVSDGFTVVQTAADGSYTIDPHDDAWYIYYSIPEDCQVLVNSHGQPNFFIKYSADRTSYDFTLTKLNGGKESKFSLFCLADPQCKDANHRNRFVKECVPDVRNHSASKGVPCYGVTLGDVTYSEGNRNCESQMPYLRTHMAKSTIGMPVFQTMGNHDYTFFSSTVTISADETSSTYNMKAQRVFEDVFGPIDYSWNRGDAHIVCMRNMQWNANNNAANYTMKFTDEQYEWLKQDLSFVPKDKLVIFCVHIPIVNSSNQNVQKVISLLKQFKETHIMSGHTHYNRNEPTLSGGMYEHVHAAVCGTWWYSRLNGDGCPNGYGVYDIEGNTIKNWYYKGVNEGMNDRDYQIRLYRGNLKCGGQHEYIQLQHGDGVLLANIFNADNNWTVKVYENGTYTGTMSKMSTKNVTPTAGTSQSDPTKPATNSSQDWWAIGYHIGVVGRGHVGGTRANYLTTNYHLYKYTLKDKTATVRVEATDRFGRTYSTSTIIGDYEYTLAQP